ncbi:hypothetical protein RRG08_037547 [Elysia crispata]|uniref:Uncharacterized protein n=1 Tax=Elysia crispata TaxID=231223 RepID=A0AAE0Y5X9_9GAST|nr:hypothetical protein RRG08_037547 [Elysia crispata]
MLPLRSHRILRDVKHSKLEPNSSIDTYVLSTLHHEDTMILLDNCTCKQRHHEDTMILLDNCTGKQRHHEDTMILLDNCTGKQRHHEDTMILLDNCTGKQRHHEDTMILLDNCTSKQACALATEPSAILALLSATAGNVEKTSTQHCQAIKLKANRGQVYHNVLKEMRSIRNVNSRVELNMSQLLDPRTRRCIVQPDTGSRWGFHADKRNTDLQH